MVSGEAAEPQGVVEWPFILNNPILDELSAPIIACAIVSLPALASEDELPAAVQGFYSWTNRVISKGIRSTARVTLAVFQACAG